MNPTYRNRAAFLAMAAAFVVTGKASTLAAEPLRLIQPLDTAASRTVTHGRCDVAGSGTDARLRLQSDGAGDALLIFKPAATSWDLSAFAGLRVTLTNPTEAPVTVRLTAENPDAKGLMNACRNAVELQPGETRDVLMRLTRRPDDPTYKPFETFYMYYKALNVRDNTIDPAAVSSFSVSIASRGAKPAIELSAITAVGTGAPAPVPFLPFIDAYGQYTHGDWPGKIYSDKDFAERRAQEQREQAGWPKPDEWDRFGGWAKGPTLKATGFFHAAKHDGKWWLVDPDGKLFWSYGPTGVGFGGDISPVSDRENWFAALPAADDKQLGQFYGNGRGATYRYYQDKAWRGFDIQQANLLRKYGPDYKSAVAKVSHERLHSWGFNTIGNWSAPEVYGLHQTPYTVAVHYNSALIHFHMPDVFDPGWEPAVRAAMEKQRDKTAGDPWNLGYFVDNERWFGWRARGAAIGEETMKNPPTRVAKIKFIEGLKAKYKSIDAFNAAWNTQHASWDALLAYQPNNKEASDLLKNEKVLADCGDFGMLFTERYFKVIQGIVKSVAPSNMYLGSRFFGHTDPALVALAANYVDVISYNIYDNPPDGRVKQYAKIDKPMMSTEWGIGSDPMQTPFRDEKLTAPTPAERAAEMTKYIEHALLLPNLVGAHFFQFRDQPLSGRPDGEATLRGFVNVADTPNFELVQANRKVAYHLYETRSQAK